MADLLMCNLYFYPRSPCGERLELLGGDWKRDKFLSTLSLRRATRNAPTSALFWQDFYPRSPCGERQKTDEAFLVALQFLSTLSLRRATIHAQSDYQQAGNFYPRSPCGERRVTDCIPVQQAPISIHALLAESDRPGLVRHGVGIAISIHALLAESDGILGRRLWHRQQFLSTLSLRRATLASILCTSVKIYFYPRSPCGERRNASYSYRSGRPISIHALLAESD